MLSCISCKDSELQVLPYFESRVCQLNNTYINSKIYMYVYPKVTFPTFKTSLSLNPCKSVLSILFDKVSPVGVRLIPKQQLCVE